MDLNKDLIEIGTIVNTFGKNGTLKLMLDKGLVFDEESVWEGKFLFYLSREGIIEPLQIKKLSQTQANLLLIDFTDINNLTIAEKLKDKKIYSLKEDMLFFEAIDYETYQVLLETNSSPLVILDQMDNGQYPLVLVKYQGQKVWIPLVEEYVQEIDDSKKTIMVKNFERLVN